MLLLSIPSRCIAAKQKIKCEEQFQEVSWSFVNFLFLRKLVKNKGFFFGINQLIDVAKYMLTNILVVWKPKIKPRKREMIKRYRKRNEESTRGKIVAMKLMYHTSGSAVLYLYFL